MSQPPPGGSNHSCARPHRTDQRWAQRRSQLHSMCKAFLFSAGGNPRSLQTHMIQNHVGLARLGHIPSGFARCAALFVGTRCGSSPGSGRSSRCFPIVRRRGRHNARRFMLAVDRSLSAGKRLPAAGESLVGVVHGAAASARLLSGPTLG
jgi:hypothetical protein